MSIRDTPPLSWHLWVFRRVKIFSYIFIKNNLKIEFGQCQSKIFDSNIANWRHFLNTVMLSVYLCLWHPLTLGNVHWTLSMQWIWIGSVICISYLAWKKTCINISLGIMAQYKLSWKIEGWSAWNLTLRLPDTSGLVHVHPCNSGCWWVEVH